MNEVITYTSINKISIMSIIIMDLTVQKNNLNTFKIVITSEK